MFLLTGCGNISYTFPYNVNSNVSSFNVLAGTGTGKADAFASDLCVVTEDRMGDGSVDMTQASAAVLFDVNNREVLYSKNAHERLYPASLTKVMTALVALKNASLDTVLTATDSVKINESGAQLCGLKSGDTMTLDQALHILLMYSTNDAAMLIAENVGGSVDHFVEMMNEEAMRLGATNTSFANPHGLSDDNHFTTAYDLYLIFNEAIKYDSFNEIIHMTSYQTTFYDKDGKEVAHQTGATPGAAKLEDVDGNGVIDSKDRKVIGSKQPSFTMSMGNRFSYKDFYFSFLFNGVFGKWMTDNVANISSYTFGSGNYIHGVKYWTPETPDAEVVSPGYQASFSHGYYKKLNYVQLRNITLGYRVNQKFVRKIGLSAIDVNFSVNNVCAFSNMRQMLNYDNTWFASFPTARSYVLGLTLTF